MNPKITFLIKHDIRAKKEDESLELFGLEKTIRRIRRIVIAVFGFTVLSIGIAMIALPGPAILVIPLGLAILATEFVWARRLLKRLKDKLPSQKEP